MTTQRLDLPTLISTYGSEDAARDFLESLRWPNGVSCIKCGSLRNTRVTGRDTFRCLDCPTHFSVRAGTVLQDSKLPLSKWMLATYMICEAKKGISSNQLKRMLGVTYKTSWFLTHRVRGAMAQVGADARALTGTVEMDETFVGGKRHFAGRKGFTGPIPGSNSLANKTTVLGAVERGGEVRFRVAGNRGRQSLKTFFEDTVSDGAEAVYTDDFNVYQYIGIADGDTKHETVNHSAKEYARGEVHTNTVEGVWSLFKRGLVGTHHQMSVKHLPAYLAETAFKYNNRDNEHIFRETLRVLVTASPLTYAELIEE